MTNLVLSILKDLKQFFHKHFIMVNQIFVVVQSIIAIMFSKKIKMCIQQNFGILLDRSIAIFSMGIILLISKII